MQYGGLKRRSGGYAGVAAAKRRKYKARKALPRGGAGYLRVGGYYGRFSGTRAELKFHDLDIDDAVIAQNGNITEDSCLTIAEGNGESDRIGRKLTVKTIQWKFTVGMLGIASTANPSSSEVVRVILYLDKQTNGATAAVADILESDDFQAFRNLANSGRFNILMDKTYTVKLFAAAGDGGAANDWSGETKAFTFFKSCSIPIEYDNSATTGVITSMRSNNIGVLLVSRDGGLAIFQSKMRIRYSDQ